MHRETWEVPELLEAMFKQACKGCETGEQEGQLADLLTHYEAVFSKNDQDIGRTELVYHNILTTEGTRPIRQPPHRLGPHKEQEAERQVQDLVARGMIEPAHGAWSSPVVLVRKKDVLAILRGLQEVERSDAARCVPPAPHRREFGLPRR